ncbi:MAG: glycosyltransferase family A protein [Halobacteriota archaeon]|nr:glycosyltransferase family A protein [Halobacteriota archaeon]
MKIDALVPCTRPERLIDALEDINSQSTPVDSILVVDNGEHEKKNRLIDYKPLSWWRQTYPNLILWRFGKNIGTNAAWNIGLRSESDFIMFFPDDMRFDHHFVKKAVYCFQDPRVVVVSARIIEWGEELPKNKENDYQRKRACGHGKAGVFMMRGTYARHLPLIPEEYFIFFGDDWIDFHVRKKSRLIWTELTHSCARHDYGSGVSAELKKTVLREERKHWVKFLEEHNESCLSVRQ